MERSHFPVVVIGILLFCVWQAWPMFQGWIVSPYDSFNWLPFLIWLLPLAWLTTKNNWYLPALAILFVFVGNIAEINTLKFIALALILAWWVPYTNWKPLWLAASVSWLPILSWAAINYPFFWVVIAKALVAAIGSIVLIRSFARVGQS